MIRSSKLSELSARAFVACLTLGLIPSVARASIPCVELKGLSIPATSIGLLTRGASIRSAESVTAAPAATLPDGRYVNEVRNYCKVIGTIAPLDSNAPVITFEVNLPAAWNGKAVQYGGGGYNGTLVSGLARFWEMPRGTLTPLAQGYATYGTDAGHQVDSLHEIQAFALNDEALVNFAYASYKKVHDVAATLITTFYGREIGRAHV